MMNATKILFARSRCIFPIRLLSNAANVNHNINVQFQDNVGVVNLGESQQVFTYDFMKAYHTALDQVESNANCKALVCTASGKIFSNGLDINLLMNKPEERPVYFKVFRALLERVLTFPMPTVAAINGHAFAAGAMMSLAHDFRIMRCDRGWISLNEIFLKIRFTHYMMAILKAKIPPGTAQNEAIVFGKRFTAKEALDYKLVHMTTEQPKLVSESVNLMKSIVEGREYDRNTVGGMKNDLYYEVLNASDAYLPLLNKS